MIVGEQDNKGKNPFDCFTLNGEKNFWVYQNVLNQVIQQSHMYMMILKKNIEDLIEYGINHKPSTW